MMSVSLLLIRLFDCRFACVPLVPSSDGLRLIVSHGKYLYNLLYK